MQLLLKEIRLAKNLSVPQLVELSGLSRRTIQDIEKRGDCLLSNAYILAKTLGVKLDELITTTSSAGGLVAPIRGYYSPDLKIY